MRTTQAILFLFHIGPKMRFPNLQMREIHSSKTKLRMKAKNDCVGRLLPEHHEVLDHLFSQVVIYAVDLVLCEQGGKMCGQLL